MQVEDCKPGKKKKGQESHGPCPKKCPGNKKKDDSDDPCAKKTKKVCPGDKKVVIEDDKKICCPPWFCTEKVKYPQTPSEDPDEEEESHGVQSCRKPKSSPCSDGNEPPPCTGPALCYERLKNPDDTIKKKK